MQFCVEKIARKHLAYFLIFVATLICINSSAKADSALTYRGQQYFEIESRIEEAIKNKTPYTLNKFLSENFSVHRPFLENLSGKEWLERKFIEPRQEWLIRDIEVQTFDNISIVSFSKVNIASKEQQFIVDVWVDSEKKLLSRYEVFPSLSAPPIKAGPSKGAPTKNQIRPDGRG